MLKFSVWVRTTILYEAIFLIFKIEATPAPLTPNSQILHLLYDFD